MRLSPGTKIPNFRGDSLEGRHLDAAQLQGARTFLQFHRFAGCPVCNLKVREFIRRSAELEDDSIRVVRCDTYYQSPDRYILTCIDLRHLSLAL